MRARSWIVGPAGWTPRLALRPTARQNYLQCKVQSNLLGHTECYYLVVGLRLEPRQLRARLVRSGLQTWKLVGPGLVRHNARGDSGACIERRDGDAWNNRSA